MTATLAGLFTTAVELSGAQRLSMMLPLCLSIAVIYKALRCQDLGEVPRRALALWVTIVMGMWAVGIGLWAAFEILA